MRLSKEQVEEFKQIYKEEFGKGLTDAEAEEIANRVMRLYELLSRPLPSERKDHDQAEG